MYNLNTKWSMQGVQDVRHLIPTLAMSAIIWSAAPQAAPIQDLTAQIANINSFTSSDTPHYSTYWHYRHWHRHWGHHWHHWRYWHRW